jgi:hypothetical protein
VRPPPSLPPQEVPPAAPPVAGKPAYTGPSSGTLIWSGRLEKGGTVTIEAGQISSGTLQGGLPGVPVLIEMDQREFAMAETPSPSNGWQRLVFRSRNKRHSVISIKWIVIR